MICQSGAKSKRNKRQEQPGFTLIEMLTSISLIVIITAVFIANYRESNTRSDLTMSAQKLVADIHLAQNNGLGLVEYGDAVPPGGWGVHFEMANPDRYIVFADLDNSAVNEPGQTTPADPGFSYYEADEGLESAGAKLVKLSDNVRIVRLTEDASTTFAVLNTTFLPPDPQVYINNGSADYSSGIIILRDRLTGEEKTVRVNRLGLAEVLD